MKITRIAVALATVTCFGAGAARADVIPFDAVAGAGSSLGDPSLIFTDLSATGEETDSETTDDDKATGLLMPTAVGAGVFFLVDGYFGNGRTSNRTGGNGPISSAPFPLLPLSAADPAPADPAPAVAPVPELGSSVLVLLGFGLLMLSQRRRLGGSFVGRA